MEILEASSIQRQLCLCDMYVCVCAQFSAPLHLFLKYRIYNFGYRCCRRFIC